MGLLENLWKVVEALIDTHLCASIHLCDVLHRLRSRRGMGTAIMELQFAQEIVSMYHNPLFLVFLDLRRAYNTVDRGRLVRTLEVHSAGPCFCELLVT